MMRRLVRYGDVGVTAFTLLYLVRGPRQHFSSSYYGTKPNSRDDTRLRRQDAISTAELSTSAASSASYTAPGRLPQPHEPQQPQRRVADGVVHAQERYSHTGHTRRSDQLSTNRDSSNASSNGKASNNGSNNDGRGGKSGLGGNNTSPAMSSGRDSDDAGDYPMTKDADGSARRVGAVIDRAHTVTSETNSGGDDDGRYDVDDGEARHDDAARSTRRAAKNHYADWFRPAPRTVRFTRTFGTPNTAATASRQHNQPHGRPVTLIGNGHRDYAGESSADDGVVAAAAADANDDGEVADATEAEVTRLYSTDEVQRLVRPVHPPATAATPATPATPQRRGCAKESAARRTVALAAVATAATGAAAVQRSSLQNNNNNNDDDDDDDGSSTSSSSNGKHNKDGDCGGEGGRCARAALTDRPRIDHGNGDDGVAARDEGVSVADDHYDFVHQDSEEAHKKGGGRGGGGGDDGDNGDKDDDDDDDDAMARVRAHPFFHELLQRVERNMVRYRKDIRASGRYSLDVVNDCIRPLLQLADMPFTPLTLAQLAHSISPAVLKATLSDHRACQRLRLYRSRDTDVLLDWSVEDFLRRRYESIHVSWERAAVVVHRFGWTDATMSPRDILLYFAEFGDFVELAELRDDDNGDDNGDGDGDDGDGRRDDGLSNRQSSHVDDNLQPMDDASDGGRRGGVTHGATPRSRPVAVAIVDPVARADSGAVPLDRLLLRRRCRAQTEPSLTESIRLLGSPAFARHHKSPMRHAARRRAPPPPPSSSSPYGGGYTTGKAYLDGGSGSSAVTEMFTAMAHHAAADTNNAATTRACRRGDDADKDDDADDGDDGNKAAERRLTSAANAVPSLRQATHPAGRTIRAYALGTTAATPSRHHTRTQNATGGEGGEGTTSDHTIGDKNHRSRRTSTSNDDDDDDDDGDDAAHTTTTTTTTTTTPPPPSSTSTSTSRDVDDGVERLLATAAAAHRYRRDVHDALADAYHTTKAEAALLRRRLLGTEKVEQMAELQRRLSAARGALTRIVDALARQRAHKRPHGDATPDLRALCSAAATTASPACARDDAGDAADGGRARGDGDGAGNDGTDDGDEGGKHDTPTPQRRLHEPLAPSPPPPPKSPQAQRPVERCRVDDGAEDCDEDEVARVLREFQREDAMKRSTLRRAPPSAPPGHRHTDDVDDVGNAAAVAAAAAAAASTTSSTACGTPVRTSQSADGNHHHHHDDDEHSNNSHSTSAMRPVSLQRQQRTATPPTAAAAQPPTMRRTTPSTTSVHDRHADHRDDNRAVCEEDANATRDDEDDDDDDDDGGGGGGVVASSKQRRGVVGDDDDGDATASDKCGGRGGGDTNNDDDDDEGDDTPYAPCHTAVLQRTQHTPTPTPTAAASAMPPPPPRTTTSSSTMAVRAVDMVDCDDGDDAHDATTAARSDELALLHDEMVERVAQAEAQLRQLHERKVAQERAMARLLHAAEQTLTHAQRRLAAVVREVDAHDTADELHAHEAQHRSVATVFATRADTMGNDDDDGGEQPATATATAEEEEEEGDEEEGVAVVAAEATTRAASGGDDDDVDNDDVGTINDNSDDMGNNNDKDKDNDDDDDDDDGVRASDADAHNDEDVDASARTMTTTTTTTADAVATPFMCTPEQYDGLHLAAQRLRREVATLEQQMESDGDEDDETLMAVLAASRADLEELDACIASVQRHAPWAAKLMA